MKVIPYFAISNLYQYFRSNLYPLYVVPYDLKMTKLDANFCPIVVLMARLILYIII